MVRNFKFVFYLFLLISKVAVANENLQIEVMNAAFKKANMPHFNPSQLDRTWICSEVSNRLVKNPFEAVFRKTGIAFTIQLAGEKSIVMTPSSECHCYIGRFGEDFNFTRMNEAGDLISEIASEKNSETGIYSSIEPDFMIKGFVTCSQVD
jgi:hypothetical protein